MSTRSVSEFVLFPHREDNDRTATRNPDTVLRYKPFRRRCNSAPCWIGVRHCELEHFSASDAFRKDPNYFLFYFSMNPRDPRLPPPLFKSHFPGYMTLIKRPDLLLDFKASIKNATKASARSTKGGSTPSKKVSISSKMETVTSPALGGDRMAHDPYRSSAPIQSPPLPALSDTASSATTTTTITTASAQTGTVAAASLLPKSSKAPSTSTSSSSSGSTSVGGSGSALSSSAPLIPSASASSSVTPMVGAAVGPFANRKMPVPQQPLAPIPAFAAAPAACIAPVSKLVEDSEQLASESSERSATIRSQQSSSTAPGSAKPSGDAERRLHGGALLAFHISCALKKQEASLKAGIPAPTDVKGKGKPMVTSAAGAGAISPRPMAGSSSGAGARDQHLSASSVGQAARDYDYNPPSDRSMSTNSTSYNNQSSVRSAPVGGPNPRRISGNTNQFYHRGTSEVSGSEYDTTSISTGVLSLVSTVRKGAGPHAEPFRIPPRMSPLVPKQLVSKTTFLFTPVPQACGAVQCSIYRDKKLMSGTRYFLLLEIPKHSYVVVDAKGEEFIDNNLEQNSTIFMCAAKQGTRSSKFTLSADRDDFDKKGKNFLAKVRKNISATDFTVLAHGPPVAVECRGKDDKVTGITWSTKKELAAIAFSQGTKYIPSQFQVVLANPNEPVPADPANNVVNSENRWLLQRFKNGLCQNNLVLKNTPPSWNAVTRSYEVDFGGRVTKSAPKNVQLEDDQRRILLTFGKAEENRYILDFVHPLSPVQAFSIALTALESL